MADQIVNKDVVSECESHMLYHARTLYCWVTLTVTVYYA